MQCRLCSGVGLRTSLSPAGPQSMTLMAAYFFFFSSSMVLYTASISISSSLYRLFTSALTAAPTLRTSSYTAVAVSIMMLSVSPYIT